MKEGECSEINTATEAVGARWSGSLRYSFATLAVIFLLGGCSFVTVSQPIGDAAVLLDSARVDGAWLAGEDTPFMARYVGPGLIKVASAEWRDGRFQLLEMLLHVRTDGRNVYVSYDTRHEGMAHLKGYAFARVHIEDGGWTAWAPSAPVFREALRTGALSGHAYEPDGEGVHIQDSQPALARFIGAAPDESLWNTDRELFYRKLRAGQ